VFVKISFERVKAVQQKGQPIVTHVVVSPLGLTDKKDGYDVVAFAGVVEGGIVTQS
jgi:hypothetical protein